MSEETLKQTNFEHQFKYYIHKGDSNLISIKDSDSLDLIGFQDGIPMLSNGIDRPAIAKEVSESLEIQSEGVLGLEPDENCVNESETQQTKIIEEKPVISPEIKPQTCVRSSGLQGKRVIIRTNSMSGQKSIIFKQKTGGKVEIPAKLSEIKQEAGLELPEQVQPSNIARVVFPQPNRSKPGILKPPQKVFIKSAVKNPQRGEDLIKETNISPFDHDYFNLPAGGLSSVRLNEGPPPLVKISRVVPDQEVIEIHDEDEVTKNIIMKVNRADNRQIVPTKIIEGVKQYSEINFDRFQAQQNKRSEETEIITKPETKILESHLKKPLEKIDLKKPPPTGNYELVNTNFIKKNKDLPQNKNTYIVMIANKQMVDKTKLNNKNTTVNVLKSKLAQTKAPVTSTFKIPIKHAPSRIFKNVETNTDDFLLEELIEKKMRERSLQNKVSKTTNTDDLPLPPPRPNLEDRIAITPSPLLLGCDPSDILELLDGPNLHANQNNMVVGPDSFVPINGKVIENCANVMDISYSRGKNVSNGWGQAPSQPSTNAWSTSLAGQNGRPHAEPWKVQLFLDLKNCDQFDSSGNMPLHNAVIQNNVNLVKRHCLALRTRQMDINTLNHNAYTALQLALLHDVNVHIVRLLLQYGSDTSILDPQGNNVLHICVTHSSEAVTKLLIGSTICADINGTNFEGYTPLIMCTLYQKYVQADDLLCTGADPNISDKKSGRTPLFHAVEANDVEMVKLLLNHRALTKVKNFFGTSPHDAMFELDTVDPEIRKLILNKDEAFKGNMPEPKGRKRRKATDHTKTYEVRPFGSKFMKIKAPRRS